MKKKLITFFSQVMSYLSNEPGLRQCYTAMACQNPQTHINHVNEKCAGIESIAITCCIICHSLDISATYIEFLTWEEAWKKSIKLNEGYYVTFTSIMCLEAFSAASALCCSPGAECESGLQTNSVVL